MESRFVPARLARWTIGEAWETALSVTCIVVSHSQSLRFEEGFDIWPRLESEILSSGTAFPQNQAVDDLHTALKQLAISRFKDISPVNLIYK